MHDKLWTAITSDGRVVQADTATKLVVALKLDSIATCDSTLKEYKEGVAWRCAQWNGQHISWCTDAEFLRELVRVGGLRQLIAMLDENGDPYE